MAQTQWTHLLWEYKTSWVRNNPLEVEAEMNECGAVGWEVFHVYVDPGDGYVKLYMKRKKLPPQEGAI